MKLEKVMPGLIIDWDGPFKASIFFDSDYFNLSKDFLSSFEGSGHDRIVVDSSLFDHGMISIVYNPAIIKSLSKVSLKELVKTIVDEIIDRRIVRSDRLAHEAHEVERTSGGMMVLPGNDR